MSNNIMCANGQCRTIIKDGDVRVKIAAYTYCEICGLIKQDKKK